MVPRNFLRLSSAVLSPFHCTLLACNGTTLLNLCQTNSKNKTLLRRPLHCSLLQRSIFLVSCTSQFLNKDGSFYKKSSQLSSSQLKYSTKNHVSLLSIFIFLLFINNSNSSNTFIVLVYPLLKPSPFLNHKLWYNSIISSSSSFSSSSPASSSAIIHVYNAPIHVFSATFTPDQVRSIRKLPGILSLFPDRVMHLHITRSPSFLGLPNTNTFTLNTSESNSIIGFIDTGIWLEHQSFSDNNVGQYQFTGKANVKMASNSIIPTVILKS